MYKAYYSPTLAEYFFQLKPKKQDIIKVLEKDGDYDESFDIKEVEITKIKVIDNCPF